MKVLLIGGTGVIGEGVIPELLARGFEVRLASRNAGEHQREWPEGVETFDADVTEPRQIEDAAAGCDVALHVTGIVEEDPPRVTFQHINIDGVRNSLTAASRASIRRFVYVSSLGAERGASPYHRSKLEGERLVQGFAGEWVIVRSANVYGPGDQMMSTLLRLVRALPVIPLVGKGKQRFQPIWSSDVGRVLAKSVDMPGLAGRIVEVAGDEVTSIDDLLARLAEITGKDPHRVPIPSALVSIVVRVAAMLRIPLPINGSELTMLLEENVIEAPALNATRSTFGIVPTPLADGLRMLADAGSEQLPSAGVGALERKQYWAVIEGARYGRDELVGLLLEQITEIMPIEFAVEPATPSVVERGVTLTAALPLRGTIQMRVEEVSDDGFTFATLEGHPLAGVVRFSAEDGASGFRFLVTIHARASSPFDWLAMQTVGGAAQRSNWETVVEKVVRLSGGSAPAGVESMTTTLDERSGQKAEDWIVALITERKRVERARDREDRMATSTARR